MVYPKNLTAWVAWKGRHRQPFQPSQTQTQDSVCERGLHYNRQVTFVTHRGIKAPYDPIPSYKRGKLLYFYEDEPYAWIEGGRKYATAPSLADHTNAITAGMKRRPRGGYNIWYEMKRNSLPIVMRRKFVIPYIRALPDRNNLSPIDNSECQTERQAHKSQ